MNTLYGTGSISSKNFLVNDCMFCASISNVGNRETGTIGELRLDRKVVNTSVME